MVLGWGRLTAQQMATVREGVTEKAAVLLVFVQITSPPTIWTTCTTFLNAKNVDLIDIQNDSLLVLVLAS